jgi:hypothetical protein
MHANELRIGNWVEYPGGWGYSKVLEIRKDGDIGGGWNLSDYQPIPLSPEILEKCGFEKDYNGYRLKDHMGLSFSVTKHGDFLACFRDKSLGVIVKHLHQLQNLFFALAGEELDIKL